MKKILMLSAAALILQATPVLADNHGGDKGAKMFEKQDTNSDGKITEAEFLEHAKKKFAERDTNGDGSISQEEAKAGKEAKRKEMKEKRKEKREERKASDSAE